MFILIKKYVSFQLVKYRYHSPYCYFVCCAAKFHFCRPRRWTRHFLNVLQHFIERCTCSGNDPSKCTRFFDDLGIDVPKKVPINYVDQVKMEIEGKKKESKSSSQSQKWKFQYGEAINLNCVYVMVKTLELLSYCFPVFHSKRSL